MARPAREIDLNSQIERGQTNAASTADSAATSEVWSAAPTVSESSTHTTELDGQEEVLHTWRLSSFDHDSYDEPMKDLTACDKECGYCGQCDY